MESKQTALSFASVSGKKLVADFDGGMTTSDGGVLLLRELEPKVGIIDRTMTNGTKTHRSPRVGAFEESLREASVAADGAPYREASGQQQYVTALMNPRTKVRRTSAHQPLYGHFVLDGTEFRVICQRHLCRKDDDVSYPIFPRFGTRCAIKAKLPEQRHYFVLRCFSFCSSRATSS